jgi:heme exporter protein D
MPDLGPYMAEVLAAYGASLALIAGLVVSSLVRSARVRRRLEEAEARHRG